MGGSSTAVWVAGLVAAHVFVAGIILRSFLVASRPRRQDRHQDLGPEHHGEQPAAPTACGKDADAGLEPAQQRDVEAPAAELLLAAAAAQGGRGAPACAQLQRLEWQGVGCSYSIRGTTKIVLQDVWGRADPADVQALMGPSGAGKSTLLDMLAMRKSVGSLAGQLLVNGQPATRKKYIWQTSYVPQEDTHIPTMTCLETLQFRAAVSLPRTWGKAQQRARITAVLAAMGLSAAEDTPVGGTLPGGLSLRGLSGGERRRLSIAAGILGAPAVLFLDEPTSGLDSFAALSVMSHLQTMAHSSIGQAIICTIHQPRDAIWSLFDTVTLLAGGRLLFHGPCDKMVPWFESLGYLHTKGSEPDWVLDLVATGFAKPRSLYGHTMRTQADLQAAAEAFTRHYTQGEGPSRAESLLPGLHAAAEAGAAAARSQSLQLQLQPAARADSGRSSMSSLIDKVAAGVAGMSRPGSLRDMLASGSQTYPAGWGRQFGALLARELVSITRNPFDVAGRVMTFTYLGLLFGLMFLNVPLASLDGIRIRSNLLFSSVLCSLLLPYVGISLFTNDKRIFLADMGAKRYRPSMYYAAKVLANTPFSCFSVLCYAAILYGMAGLRAGAAHFCVFAATVLLMFLIASQVLHLFTVVLPNQDSTFSASILWTAVQLLCSSFFVQFSQVDMQWLTQLRYVSAAYFGLEALVQNEFGGGTAIDCSSGLGKELSDVLLRDGLVTATPLQLAVLEQAAQPQPGCQFRADAVVKYLGFSRSFGVSLVALLAYLGALHAATFLALLLVARRDRR